MRVAVIHPFPNRPCAETELIPRMVRAMQNLQWDAAKVVTSADIRDFQPDCVLSLHFYSPKLTAYPTLACMWNPPHYWEDKPDAFANLLSCDGFIPGSEQISQYIRDMLFSTGKHALIADFLLRPSCQATAFTGTTRGASLFYAGTWWDRQRHMNLFEKLSRKVPLHIYGPPTSWADVDIGAAYRGSIPFDGQSVLTRIQEAGVALCIHGEEHRRWNLHSMRLFEAAAAGAVILSDDMKSTRDHFGDTVLYIDVQRPVDELIEQIEDHMAWIAQFPEKARALAGAAHRVFVETFALEKQLAGLPAFLEQVKKASHFVRTSSAPTPLVEYIVRVGSRPARLVDRCLGALRDQSYWPLGVVLSRFAPVDGLEAIQKKYAGDFATFRVVEAEGGGVRSHALWAGLRAVSAPFFANCDDDDLLHPNHAATLMEVLDHHPDIGLAYSGTIEFQEGPDNHYDQVNFDGPLGQRIEENCRLSYFKPFDPDLLVELDNYITSHSWIARRRLLTTAVLDDPNMPVLEDLYLLALFLEQTDFRFSWRPTAEYQQCPQNKGQSHGTHDDPAWKEAAARIQLRTQYFPRAAAYRRFRAEVQPLVKVQRSALLQIARPENAHVLNRLVQLYYSLRGMPGLLRDWRSLGRRACKGAYLLTARGPREACRRLAGLARTSRKF